MDKAGTLTAQALTLTPSKGSSAHNGGLGDLQMISNNCRQSEKHFTQFGIAKQGNFLKFQTALKGFGFNLLTFLGITISLRAKQPEKAFKPMRDRLGGNET